MKKKEIDSRSVQNGNTGAGDRKSNCNGECNRNNAEARAGAGLVTVRVEKRISPLRDGRWDCPSLRSK
jgi:hypothetical protein